METMSSSSTQSIPQDATSYDELSMQQILLFSDSLEDLKNLRTQLYSAAEYFELSYINDDQKQIVVDTLKDYAIKALVNTVDHLGSVTYKVNELLDERVDDVSGAELRVSCIEQRIRTCQTYTDNEGLSQQLSVIPTPKYHKRYIFPVEETTHNSNHTVSRYQNLSLDDENDWHQFKNAVRATIRETPPPSLRRGRSLTPSPRPSLRPGFFSFSEKRMESPKKRAMSPLRASKRAISPLRASLPFLRSGSVSSRPTTPVSSRPTTPVSGRPTIPNSSNGRRRYPSEPRKSYSMNLHAERDNTKEVDQYPSKSKRLLKALLSRRKSKKDDMLYNYLDEY